MNITAVKSIICRISSRFELVKIITRTTIWCWCHFCHSLVSL